MNDTESDSEDGGVGGGEVDDENNSINPILIAEDGEYTEDSGDSDTEGGGDSDSESSESTQHSTEQDDVSECDAIVDPKDAEEQQQQVYPDEEVDPDEEEVPTAQRPWVVQNWTRIWMIYTGEMVQLDQSFVSTLSGQLSSTMAVLRCHCQLHNMDSRKDSRYSKR